MRLVEFEEEVKYQEAVAYILKHCKPFMKDMMSGGKFMWSGRKKKDMWFEGTVRKDRKPVDTEDDAHVKMDDLFLKKFGWRARSNVLFCSGSSNTTSYYGDAYSIWPMGKYKFVYSTEIRDVTVHLENLRDAWIRQQKALRWPKGKKSKDQEEAERLDADLIELMKTYTDKDIKKAIKSGNEIMLHCDKYVALNFSFSLNLEKGLRNLKK